MSTQEEEKKKKKEKLESLPTAFSPLGGLSCPHKKKKEIRKLGTFKKIPEMFGFDDEYPAVHPKVIEVFY